MPHHKKPPETRVAEGTIVLPVDVTAERIVGIVTNGGVDSVTVVWLSDARGALCCVEAPSDLTYPEVEEVLADNIDRAWLADALALL